MPAIYSKVLLSNSISGSNISVSGSNTSSLTTIHTTTVDTSSLDEIYVYGCNNNTSSTTLTLCWGNTGSADVTAFVLGPVSGRTLIADGKLLSGGLSVSAFVNAGNIIIDGFVNRIVQNATFYSLHPIVTLWVNRVVKNGGSIPSATTQNAMSAFVSGLESNNILKKISMINCLVNDSWIASMTPLIRGSGYDLWISHSFSTSDLSSNGITGDGSSKYIDMGLEPFSAFDINGIHDIGISIYTYKGANNVAQDEAEVSGYDTIPNTVTEFLTGYHGGFLWDAYSTTPSSGRITYPFPYYRGYASANYVSFAGVVTQSIYAASPFLPHTTITSSSAPTAGTPGKFPTYLFVVNNAGGVPSNYSTKTISFVAAHYALTANESFIFYNLIQTMRISLGGGYINSDPVQEWVNRVVSNSGSIPSANTQTALRTFYNGLVSNNLLGKMKVINAFVPDNLTASLTPFWNMTGSFDPWTNHGFAGSDLTVNGLIPNGTSKYLQTGFVPAYSYTTSSDAGITVYVVASSSNSGNDVDLGVFQSNTQDFIAYPNFNGTAISDMYTVNAGAGRISATVSNFTGYYSANHGTNLGGGVIHAIYTASSVNPHGALVSSSVSQGGTLPTLEAYCFAYNNAGSAANFNHHVLSFAAIHSGLTLTESSNFYTLVQALRTSLGGGFV